MPDSERATTAARNAAAKALAAAQIGAKPGRAYVEGHHIATVDIVLAAARPVIASEVVREEHARLRSPEAIERAWRAISHAQINRSNQLDYEEVVQVVLLALLGESTQEQANKEER